MPGKDQTLSNPVFFHWELAKGMARCAEKREVKTSLSNTEYWCSNCPVKQHCGRLLTGLHEELSAEGIRN